MNIRITARHMEVSDSAKSFVQEKFAAIERFFHGVKDAEVILKQEDRKTHCEVILHIKSKGDIVIDVARDTLHEAVDIAVSKCERQLRRTKEKLEDRRRSESSTVNLGEMIEEEAESEADS